MRINPIMRLAACVALVVPYSLNCTIGQDDIDDFCDLVNLPICEPEDSGEQSCCEESDEPGCNDPEIQECTCEAIPGADFCCEEAWSDECVTLAVVACGLECDENGDAGDENGDAGDENGDAGDENGDAGDENGDGGEGESDPPPQGEQSCCEVSGGPSCSDQAVTACVCAIDPFCCNSQWDNLCIEQAESACGLVCAEG